MSESPLDLVENELLKIQLESMRRENSDLRNQVLSMPALPAAAIPADDAAMNDFVKETEAQIAAKDATIEQLRQERDQAAKTREELVRINAEKQAREEELAGRLVDASGRNDELALELARVQDALVDAREVIRVQEDDQSTAHAHALECATEIDQLRLDVKRLDQAEDAALELFDQEVDANAVLRAKVAVLELDAQQRDDHQVSVGTSVDVERLQAQLDLAGKENTLRRQMVAELQVMLANQGKPFAYPGVEMVGFQVGELTFVDVRLSYDLGASWFTALQVPAEAIRFIPRATAADIERMIEDQAEVAA